MFSERTVARLARTSCAALALTAGLAQAQTTPQQSQTAVNTQIEMLKQQLEASAKQMEQFRQALEALTAAQAQSEAKINAAQTQASQAKAAADAVMATEDLDSNGHAFLEHKKTPGLTFYVPHGEITGYGNIDVSFDYVAKNVGSEPANYAASPPIGNFSWMPDLSTNLSYFGIRGFETIDKESSLRLVYQLEAGFDLTATPGTKETNSAQSNTVNGALFSRNSFIGFSSPTYGAIKFGKTDAPYKQSTGLLNPFAGTLGDNAAIMGNTGGDSRVEFGARLDHSIWYESPNMNGFAVNLLFSPGQNRSYQDDNIAAGESDCTGGNIPQSGADVPVACNDGAYGNAFSGNVSYTHGGLYATAAGEYHQKVNRSSDISDAFATFPSNATSTGYGVPANFNGDAYAAKLYNDDVGDEWAAKVALLYKFSTGTSVGAIGEYMHRSVPSDLTFQNERTRWGSWLLASQEFGEADVVHFGWAHAFRAPGDPGQHVDALLTLAADPNIGYASNNNQSDLLTLLYKHTLMPGLKIYADWAFIDNGPAAHYAVGAGGRGVITDCHDASDASGGADGNPHCYTGQKIMGFSTGINYNF
ncbi:MAG TPA: porin [Magnetospirillaceae bacterium]|nr:porin [Magnetospirillaceae bacterium]